ncbi:MAG: PilZ domain-containing protein [Anaerolineae bacterium]|nr:PilZ domain-containing protein [Anaerolineae bacterium]
MENKRKLKRRHLIYYLRVFDQTNSQLVGHLVDITQEGLMLISEQPLNINETYHFRMILPSEILSKVELTFTATVVWSKKDVNPDFFATGFSLGDISTEDVMIIESLIHRYGFND